jgi:replicative DNA helicase
MAISPRELIPLYSAEAEMSTLGAMLISERAAEEIATTLIDEDFYRPAHRLIFRAMKALLQAHKPIDQVTLEDELKARGNLADIGGPDYLLEIAMYVPSASNSAYYAQIVQDKSSLRQLESAGRDIVGMVHNPDTPDVGDKIDKAEQMVFSVGARSLKKQFQHVETLAKEFFVDVDHIVETGTPMSGLKVGFTDLDDMTSGFYPGDFVVIGARPAMGKTSLVLDFALNVCKEQMRQGRRGSVAVFSLEMSAIQLVRRMASMLSGVSMEVLKTGKISNDNYQRLADGCEQLYSMPLFIDDGSDLSPLEMRGKCRRLKAEHGLNLVVVDYLQLMKGAGRVENRVQEISEIARSCKAMAKELDLPVIALSQLSRAVENREDKRPQLADIRESGSIEAEADTVMLLYRESYYKAKEERRSEVANHDEVQPAEVIVAKHRNGPTGKVILGFQPSYVRYRNLERGTYYEREAD